MIVKEEDTVKDDEDDDLDDDINEADSTMQACAACMFALLNN